MFEKNNSGLFIYLFFLTLLFFLFEICFFLQCSSIYLGGIELVANHLKIPTNIIPGVIYFIFAEVLVHIVWTLCIWMLTRFIGAALQLSWRNTVKMGFGLWMLSALTILLLNQWLFPNSKFAVLMSILFTPLMTKISLVVLFLFFIALIFSALIAIRSLLLLKIVAISTIIFCGFYFWATRSIEVKDASTASRPNIILIGIDALRPDFLGYFGFEKTTPHLDEFLNQATVFSEALTPLARTFPAWVSILTGKYPKINGMRTSLPDQRSLDLRTSLPIVLRAQGYETVFATDETRFSNIDERFGFDQVIEPPIGVNDFLLGSMNDFPLSNLLINSSIGKWLFPHSYANRPADMTYDPNSFLAAMNFSLRNSREKPLFLAIHFCLTHYPYIWGNKIGSSQSINNYYAAIHRVDQQFADFLKILKDKKILEHSIVVVLSDHGEAIELNGDRMTDPDLFIPGSHNPNKIIPHFYPSDLPTEKVNQSVGHGTDVLSLTQYHIVFAFRLFGMELNQAHAIPGRVSLLDIQPTIFSLLKMKEPHESGHSLQKYILEKNAGIPANDDFFIESDFSPPAVHSVHPETKKLLFEGIDYFQIDPKTTRVSVKKKMLDLIISSKQYADFYGDWVLAVYPQNKKDMVPILVNLRTGEWTNDMSSGFAKKSPEVHMLQKLRGFYRNEIRLSSS